MFINVSEALRAQRGWKPPQEQLFALRDTYYPGDVGWDPLGLKPVDPGEFLYMQNAELSHGRLAMIAVAGMVVQELINGKPVWEDLQVFAGTAGQGYAAIPSFLAIPNPFGF